MSTTPPKPATLLLWPLLALALTSCATNLPPTPPVPVKPPAIPSPPAIKEPQPSGAYWLKHCKLVLSTQQTLKIPQTQCERS